MEKLSRRSAIALFGAAAGTALSSSLLLRTVFGSQDRQPSEANPQFPWPYEKLNPDVIAERAYHDYYKGHCMYGTFASIIGELADKKGEPYRSFPMMMMKYGAGGVTGWASLCGALNGAAAAIAMFVENPEALINELYGWHERTALPDFRPKNPKFEIVKSTAGSVLCHASVSNWCEVAKVKSFSKERAERCAWIAASIARFTTELLNAHFAGTFKAAFPIPERVKTCRGCHDQGGMLENSRGKMDCNSCHPKLGPKHPKI
ncbi:MAG: hypothetical protein A2X94_02755 [Bdellovibrionales bacterium GWB1_55_8]|nr:MAG: hypothetical protein A2X94_02755 [Bdellovibrionales bacterium GWB1_55_8]